MKKRVDVITYKGKSIIYADYSELRGQEFSNVIAQQEAESLKSREKTILHLLNFTNCRMDDNTKERADKMIKTLSEQGYTVKTACFGIRGIQRLIARAVKRNMYFARSLDDAKEWLTTEGS